MQELIAAEERTLTRNGLKPAGFPSKHQLSCGMVYRNIAIVAPDGTAFAPLDRCQTDDHKALVQAFLLLKEHLVAPFKENPDWDHAKVMEWAKNDPLTLKRKVSPDAAPETILLETPSRVDDEGQQVPGAVRVIINDIFSYDVRAVITPPNLLKIFGRHERPRPSNLPPGTKVIERLSDGEWVKSNRDAL